MDFKSWWYDNRTTKWQIIIGTLIVAITFFGTFSYLDTYQFEEWKYSAFSKSLMGILMGTVALGVITGVIIIFQSIVSMDREKNQKIFNERLSLYKQFTRQTMNIITDNILDKEEAEQLKVIEKEVLMIASPTTYRKWSSLYREIQKLRSSDEEEIENEEEILLSISDKSIDFINSCRLDLEIGVIDKETIEYSKSESRIEIKKSKKFTVSNFADYSTWLKQRLANDKKISDTDQSVHREVYDYISQEYADLKIKYRKHGLALYHNNGKKVGNLNLDNRYGVALTLLRDVANQYRFPEIKHQCKNTRNDYKACEYYQIINIDKFDQEIKKEFANSYSIRNENKATLTAAHNDIKKILNMN